MHGQHRRDARSQRASKRRAVEDVEPRRAPRERDGVPERIAENARRAARPAEGEELELQVRSAAERAEQPSNDPRSARARLHERGRVHADPHASTSSIRATTRSASTGSGYWSSSSASRPRAPAIVDVLLVQHRLPVRLDFDRVGMERDPLLLLPLRPVAELERDRSEPNRLRQPRLLAELAERGSIRGLALLDAARDQVPVAVALR